ncbi:hypothetical protein, variant [Exophiala xenobiotica]|uniref:Zn(2)-C6 fungal-type domain-containing protein n=1 Tax=Exophiala xenobiotica TaxID=348802 RepID=A0A0D2F0I0_9EURO|nr:hypothetical protein, variant [Exophiala xenobiotica]KIW53474.1 hypothetical protein, variant [Exophiala xenobiotica]
MAATTRSYSARESAAGVPDVKYRRTNSLAFAKSDCHTCSSLGARCDRQRPRCTPCQDSGILCQGYSMKLTWHRSHSVANKPPKVVKSAIIHEAAGDLLPSCDDRGDISDAQQSTSACNVIGDAQQSTSACNESFVDLGRAKRHKKFMFVAARPPKRRKKSHSDQSIKGDVSAISTRRSSTMALPKASVQVVDDKADPQMPLQVQQSQRQSSNTAEDRPVLTSHEEGVQMHLLAPSTDVGDLDMPPLSECDPSSRSVTWQQQDLNWVSPPCQQPSENIDLESLEQCLEIQRRPLNTPSPSFATDISLGFSQNLWDEDLDEQSPSSAAHSTTSDLFAQDMMMSIPQMCYSTLTDKFYGLLDMYDQEFCKYPITNDFSVNPYRYRPETTRGSQHLLHAIVALSCHFTLRSSTQPQPPADAVDHKNTALVLYQGALSKKDIHIHGLSLLDTAMALWQFEATLSALNIWRTHLGDAYSLLELCGGIPRWSTGIKANIQVAMFLWYPTSLVSLPFPSQLTDLVLGGTLWCLSSAAKNASSPIHTSKPCSKPKAASTGRSTNSTGVRASSWCR